MLLKSWKRPISSRRRENWGQFRKEMFNFAKFEGFSFLAFVSLYTWRINWNCTHRPFNTIFLMNNTCIVLRRGSSPLDIKLEACCSTLYNNNTLCSTLYNNNTLCSTLYNKYKLCSTLYNNNTLCSTLYINNTLCSTLYNNNTLCSTLYINNTLCIHFTTILILCG